jgi:hypothetical protein
LSERAWCAVGLDASEPPDSWLGSPSRDIDVKH